MSKNEIANADTPSELPAYMASSKGLGNENVGAGDKSMPYLKVLQALSPEVEEIPDAKAGEYYNSITHERATQLQVVNLHYLKYFALFKDRKLGGGFEGNHATKAAAQMHLAENKLNPAEWEITPTGRHICLLLDKEGNASSPVIINMSGSKMRVSNNWNSAIGIHCKETDRFGAVWTLSTQKQTKGTDTWWNMAINYAGFPSEELYCEAFNCYEQVVAQMNDESNNEKEDAAA